MTGWQALFNHVTTTASVALMIWLAVMFWRARGQNGLMLRRLSEFIAYLAVFFIWTWLARLDGAFQMQGLDLLPGNQLLVLRDWVGLGHLGFVVVLVRLWRAVR